MNSLWFMAFCVHLNIRYSFSSWVRSSHTEAAMVQKDYVNILINAWMRCSYQNKKHSIEVSSINHATKTSFRVEQNHLLCSSSVLFIWLWFLKNKIKVLLGMLNEFYVYHTLVFTKYWMRISIILFHWYRICIWGQCYLNLTYR